MTAPVWMASPPEVWSTLLSSGPGPAALQVAAAQWQALSVQYTEVAQELTALVSGVEAGSWQGDSAARYAAAHLPFLAWLAQAGAHSAAAAAQHEAAAVAYTGALAAMPTMPELVANHTLHATLIATNFFGINTIPIAVNEADYLRMWVQAALTMTGYQTASTAAVAATPKTAPAPMIMKSDMPDMAGENGGAMSGGDSNGGKPPMWWMMGDHIPQTPEDWYHALFPPQFNPFDPNSFGMMYPSLEKFLPRIGEMFTAYSGDPAQLVQAMFFLGAQFIVHRTLFLTWIVLNNPAMLGTFISANPIYSVGLAAGAVAPVAAAPAAAGGFAGLAGLAGIPQPPAPAVAPVAPMPPPPATPPVPAGLHAPVTPPAPATAPAPPPGAPAAPPPAAGSPPAPVLGPEGAMSAQNAIYPHLATAVTARSETAARRKKQVPHDDTADTPAPAVEPAREAEKVRRQRRKKMSMLGRGYEYMDLEPEADSATAASQHGAGPIGFAGTAATDVAPQASGLATLAVDSFRDSPETPMMPGTWHPGAPDGGGAG
ncbi:PPE family protein [Mycolicibacillus trivialis]|uniref:PPE family protein n=2 Tax=Mycolicibacillus trivialis TaxID=1798 RepID=UPI000A154608